VSLDPGAVVYHHPMGSSGMKRKGRSHLPKVGTRQANEHELHDRRAEALHPFATDPWQRRGVGYTIMAIVVAAVVVIGMVALIAAT
jgi:hypothetical protein